MTTPNIVFNDQLDLYGQRFISGWATIPTGENPDRIFQRRQTLATLFEHLLLFDKVAIRTGLHNEAFQVLVEAIGIDNVQSLIEKNVILPVLWTPGIFTMTGTQRDDGSIDESTILGHPPIGSSSLSDIDPEKNIDSLLNRIQLPTDRKKSFRKAARDKYVLPNNNLAQQSVEIVLDAYTNNRLASLSLPFVKKPEELNMQERGLLLDLGRQVLETSILAEKRYKSYDQYTNLHLAEEAMKNIESAFHVSENTSRILDLENIADIKTLAFEERIQFDRIWQLRYKGVVKNYRKWINSISIDTDATTIAKEYIDEIMGKNKFVDSRGGKLLRTVSMLVVGSAVGAAISNTTEAVAGGAIIGQAADLGLSLMDTYILDGVLKGWNPSMFVDKIRKEVEAKNK